MFKKCPESVLWPALLIYCVARMKQCLAEISPLYAEQLAETCLQAGDNCGGGSISLIFTLLI